MGEITNRFIFKVSTLKIPVRKNSALDWVVIV